MCYIRLIKNTIRLYDSNLLLQVYKVHSSNQAENTKGRSKKETALFLKENTVKATKELVAAKQQQSHDLGAKMTLAEVGNNLVELKREQANLKNKLNSVEENIKTILDIMVSRNPKVERLQMSQIHVIKIQY